MPSPPVVPFTKFSDTYSDLNSQLLEVSKEYSKGQSAVYTALSKQSALASGSISTVVNSLTATQIGYCSGMVFRNPGNTNVKDAKNNNQGDILASIEGAWQTAASDYVKGDSSTGASDSAKLQTRLQDFDTAISTLGKTPVPPDK